MDLKNMENETGFDALEHPVSQPHANNLTFDRYDIIGMLFLMYGWWRIISGSWLIALAFMVIGWLLAFAEGPKRESLVRVIGGVSSDAMALLNSGFQKAQRYLKDKQGKSSTTDVSK
jgi:hypothetical protein